IRIAGDPGQVLDRATRVHVAFDAESGYEFDRIPDRLAEGVPAVTADGGHEACWHRHRGSGYHTRGINRAVRLALAAYSGPRDVRRVASSTVIRTASAIAGATTMSASESQLRRAIPVPSKASSAPA